MNDKPTLIELTNREERIAFKLNDDLGKPYAYHRGDCVWVEADEYRAWKGFQVTSEGQSR